MTRRPNDCHSAANTQKAAATTCQTQVVPAFDRAQRAESYGAMHLSGLLHCQYLPSSTKPVERRLEKTISSLTLHHGTGTFATCFKKELWKTHQYREDFLSAAKLFSLTSLNLLYVVQETNDIITRQLPCVVGRKAICLVLLLQNKHQQWGRRPRELQLLAIF